VSKRYTLTIAAIFLAIAASPLISNITQANDGFERGTDLHSTASNVTLEHGHDSNSKAKDHEGAIDSDFQSNICPSNIQTRNSGNGYIISYDPIGIGSTPTNLYDESQNNKDWDLDGFDNSVDFFPLDSARAVMPLCGTNFGNFKNFNDYNLGVGDISSIDAMVVVDWDKDGDYDILIGGTHKDEVDYYGSIMGIQNLGGDQGFAKAVSLKNLGDDFRFFDPHLYGDVDDIAVIDLLGDGRELGLIVGTQGWTRYYLSNGWNELGFLKQDENPWVDDLTYTQRARDIIVADIDNDGDHDWAINYRSTESYYDGWKPRVEIFDGYIGRLDGVDIESGEVKYNIDWFDVDRNGHLEILACKYNCDIWTTFNRNLSTSIIWSWDGDSTAITSSASSDFDGDGYLDLAIGTRKNIYIFSNHHNGILSDEPTFILDNKNTRYLHWADIDGNGWLDLLTGNDGKDQIFGNFNGDLSLVWKSVSSSKTNFILTADIDVDGDLDIIGSDLDSVFIIMNNRDNNASYDGAMESLLYPYLLMMTLLLLVPVLRLYFMITGNPESFLKKGVALFFLLQIIFLAPLMNDDQNGDGWDDSVTDCNWNEACVANEMLSSYPILSIFSEQEMTYMALEEEFYEPIFFNFILGNLIISILIILTFVKHYRKTGTVHILNTTNRESHLDHTISSILGISIFVCLSLQLSPYSTLGTTILKLIFAILALVILIVRTNLVFRQYIDSLMPKNTFRQYIDSFLTKNTSSHKVQQTKIVVSGKPLKTKKQLHNKIYYNQLFLNSKTVVELKAYLRANNLKVSGTKSELIDRLLQANPFRKIPIKYDINKKEEISNQPMYMKNRQRAQQSSRSTPERWKNPGDIRDDSQSSKKHSSIRSTSEIAKNTGDIRSPSNPYSNISINSPVVELNKIAEIEGRSIQEIYEDLLDDGIINKSNVTSNPVETQQLNEIFEQQEEISIGNPNEYDEWMKKVDNYGQKMPNGAIGNVWRLKTEQGTLFIKTAKDDNSKKVLIQEIQTLEELMEENLNSQYPQIHFKSKDENNPILVMTQVGERSFEQDYYKLETSKKILFLKELAEDIHKLHKYGHHIHRDIKPGNIGINDPKSNNSIYSGLIDFGSARVNNKKQGKNDRFVSLPYTHPSQAEMGVRCHPGQDWYSFTWIAMCVVIGEKHEAINSMIQGGNIKTKFSSSLKSISDNQSLNGLEELVDLVTKFGEESSLKELEEVAKKMLGV